MAANMKEGKKTYSRTLNFASFVIIFLVPQDNYPSVARLEGFYFSLSLFFTHENGSISARADVGGVKYVIILYSWGIFTRASHRHGMIPRNCFTEYIISLNNLYVLYVLCKACCSLNGLLTVTGLEIWDKLFIIWSLSWRGRKQKREQKVAYYILMFQEVNVNMFHRALFYTFCYPEFLKLAEILEKLCKPEMQFHHETSIFHDNVHTFSRFWRGKTLWPYPLSLDPNRYPRTSFSCH